MINIAKRFVCLGIFEIKIFQMQLKLFKMEDFVLTQARRGDAQRR